MREKATTRKRVVRRAAEGCGDAGILVESSFWS